MGMPIYRPRERGSTGPVILAVRTMKGRTDE